MIYRADQDTDFVIELYSVPLTGGPVTKLLGPFVSEAGVERRLTTILATDVVGYSRPMVGNRL